MTFPRIKRALISVSDKLGLADFARGLAAHGVELFSTGGTRKYLENEGLKVFDVAEYTGFPEMLDGRVKTLHPKIHGGILARHDRPDDLAALEKHGILTFELVVVNLYPFEATVAREGVSFDEAVENIDIGGPSLIRAASKNHAFITVATDASQYAAILEQVAATGSTTLELRTKLCQAAFARTASYDQAIATYMAGHQRSDEQLIAIRKFAESTLAVVQGKLAELKQQLSSAGTTEASQITPEDFPASLQLVLRRKEVLRYGENPHQQAALYAQPNSRGANLVAAQQLTGKELSYNNLLDLDSALAIVRSLSGPSVVVLKHNNPCGAATNPDLAVATRNALDGDPVSAFGSVIGYNRPVDAASAEVLSEPGRFVEAIVAPDFEPAALEILTTKPKWKANVRLMKVGQFDAAAATWQVRQIDGGLLVQQSDVLADPESEWQVPTSAKPTDAQLDELRFGWAIVRHVKSNAITVSKDHTLRGAGAGQMSRVDSVEIAIKKAGQHARGAVLASDAFFPFPDSIQQAAAAGIVALIQPGGSRRDDEVIAACNEYELPMVFTGRRHFKH